MRLRLKTARQVPAPKTPCSVRQRNCRPRLSRPSAACRRDENQAFLSARRDQLSKSARAENLPVRGALLASGNAVGTNCVFAGVTQRDTDCDQFLVPAAQGAIGQQWFKETGDGRGNRWRMREHLKHIGYDAASRKQRLIDRRQSPARPDPLLTDELCCQCSFRLPPKNFTCKRQKRPRDRALLEKVDIGNS